MPHQPQRSSWICCARIHQSPDAFRDSRRGGYACVCTFGADPFSEAPAFMWRLQACATDDGFWAALLQQLRANAGKRACRTCEFTFLVIWFRGTFQIFNLPRSHRIHSFLGWSGRSERDASRHLWSAALGDFSRERLRRSSAAHPDGPVGSWQASTRRAAAY